MPKVGDKHFKYTKKGREKAKKHAKKTGQEIKYAMDGGMMNRKYYASGGAIYSKARKRKTTGRLTVEDIARSRKPSGRITKDDLARAIAKVRKPSGTINKDDIKRAYIALGGVKAQKKVGPDWHKKGVKYAMGGKIQAMRKKRKEKKKGRSALAGAQAALAGMTIGESFRSFGQKFGQDPSRAGHVGKLRKMEEEYSQMMKDLLKSGKGSRGKSKAQNMAKGGKVKGGSMRKAPGDWMRKFPVIGSRDWWGTSEGAKAAKKMQPKIPKPQKFPGKISKKQLKLLQEARLEMSKGWSKHFPKVIGKFPIIGKPFRAGAKVGEAASKFIKRRKKFSGAKALKGKK